jgi:hypothetical protein
MRKNAMSVQHLFAGAVGGQAHQAFEKFLAVASRPQSLFASRN